ncbi:MAG: TIGR03960 family B12-binding radical SAM protein [Acidobacteriota bacterium]|nr:MAG: TIGR03960 family B12-binding radical SAM protein [Acidobacteriota bacterium]
MNRSRLEHGHRTISWREPARSRALDRLLTRVEKPTRYIGGEWNAIHKDPTAVETSIVLAFPDIYEIGMSHLGYRILYAMLNALDGVAAERAFMPWSDMLALLRKHELPLVSLESRRPLAEFDLVGFSMQYELTITNVLAMLEQGGIALTSEERGEDDPLVLAGGPVIFNPEPFAPFFDLVLVGDAEQALPEMVRLYAQLKRDGATRGEVIRQVACSIGGWYAPALYDVEPEPELGMLIPQPREGLPHPVKRAVVYDLDRYPFPEQIIVPHAEIVHDRVSFELMRGCPVGCRFCQAGYVYRPTREREPSHVFHGVKRSLDATGYDEFSLSSLNTGEYGAIEPLLTALMDEMDPRRISVSLSSMHATTITETLAEQVKRVRKSGFTIAPEAGSQRLRDVINKNLNEEQILEATRLAFGAGWQLMKLYFMIGLPTETDQDIDAIVELTSKIARQGREIGGRRVRVTLSASTFVPKPFTPFQWFGMQPESDFSAKQQWIRSRLPRSVQFRHHDQSGSWLEGVLSRADRSLAPAIIDAYRRGAVLDGWTEHLDIKAWRAAFEARGIDAEAWATRPIPIGTSLPWEGVDPLVSRKWLEREYHNALSGRTVIACGAESCTGCAPFAGECVRGIVAAHKWEDFVPAGSPHPVPQASLATPSQQTGRDTVPDAQHPPGTTAVPPTYRYRAQFVKQRRSRFLGHLDLVRALSQSLRRAGIQVVYSAGFKPRPKLSLSPALALGIASRCEFVDFETHERLDTERFATRINGKLPEGLEVTAIVPIRRPTPALQEAITRARYEAKLEQVGAGALEQAVAAFLARERVEVDRVRKNKIKTIDIRPHVERLVVNAEGALEFTLVMGAEGAPRPSELLDVLVGERGRDSEIERVGLFAEIAGRFVSPLLAGRLAHTA